MHSLLRAAHDAAPEAARPPAPFHGGVDANPQLGSFGYGGIAIFLAESIVNDVSVADRDRYDDWLALAKSVYDAHARATGNCIKVGTKTKRRVLTNEAVAHLRAQVMLPEKVLGVRRGLSPALEVANTAVFAAHDIELQGGGSDVTSAVRRSVERTVGVLGATSVRPFLLELDRRLLREELRAMLALRGDPRSARVAACLWRAAAGKARGGRASGANVTHWIGRLDDASYLLLWKVGSRWTVASGTRDDILATVPDAQMEAAVATVR